MKDDPLEAELAVWHRRVLRGRSTDLLERDPVLRRRLVERVCPDIERLIAVCEAGGTHSASKDLDLIASTLRELEPEALVPLGSLVQRALRAAATESAVMELAALELVRTGWATDLFVAYLEHPDGLIRFGAQSEIHRRPEGIRGLEAALARCAQLDAEAEARVRRLGEEQRPGKRNAATARTGRRSCRPGGR